MKTVLKSQKDRDGERERPEGAQRGPFMTAKLAESNESFRSCRYQGIYCVTAHRTIAISNTYVHQFLQGQTSSISTNGELIGAMSVQVDSGNGFYKNRNIILPKSN